MKILSYFLVYILTTAGFVYAEEKPTLNGADTAWIIVATALLMLMTPAGLSLFYGGMTKSKNILTHLVWSLYECYSFSNVGVVPF